jgi:hypothetical protein
MSGTESPYGQPSTGPIEKRALYEYHLALDCILSLQARWSMDLEPERTAYASRLAAERSVSRHLLTEEMSWVYRRR